MTKTPVTNPDGFEVWTRRFCEHLRLHVEASTTAIYTRVSIKHLVEVHRRCHPGARVVEPKKEPEVEEAKEKLFEQLDEEDDEDG